MKATIETKWDSGDARTFRDENGGLWRVEVDAGDGTLAVCEINDGPNEPEDEDTVGMTPCGWATWEENGVEIVRVPSHGENHTDPSEYYGPNGEVYAASVYGWVDADGE